MTELQPLTRRAGYPPIEDHGLVGDGRGSALIGRDGSVGFMCVPRFDDPPLFCPLLDRRRGGELRLAAEQLRRCRQRYVADSGVLVTEQEAAHGTVEVTDAFLLRPGARLEEDAPAAEGILVRRARVTHGSARLRVTVRPRGDPEVERTDHEWRLNYASQRPALLVRCSRPLDGPETTVQLHQGEELHLLLDWNGPVGPRPGPSVDDRIERTVAAWQRWAARIRQDVPQPALVRRSAITLKLLDHFENGAIVAAPTSSFPEHIGGSRNWDYRYAWIRDAAFTVFALRRLGLLEDALGFVDWALRAAGRNHAPRVLYDVAGKPPPAEMTDPDLEGYRGSAPVRWGNAAAEQLQHDVHGELLDCAFQRVATGSGLPEELWERLRSLADEARTVWRRPDRGIWEIRAHGRPFTYSVAMCQVALNRAARLAHRLDLPGDAHGWTVDARRLTRRILTDAWDAEQNSLTEHLGGGSLDASLLALPLRRVLPADHPRMVATTRAVADRLDAGDGLLYRYLPDQSADGIGEPEGAFVLCSFWMVDNLAGQGRVEEASELFGRLCARTSGLGLLSEQIDPADGSLLGNFPQGLSHVGLISSAVNLARCRQGIRPELTTRSWSR